MPGRRRDLLRLWGPVLAWMAFLFAMSSRAGWGAASQVPDWMTHGAGYAVLAALACRGLAGGLGRPVTARVAALAVLIATAYGVTDELHQSFVPGRVADAWDLLKDLAGAVAGALACAWPRPTDEQRRKAA
jgi:VanZ family protein